MGVPSNQKTESEESYQANTRKLERLAEIVKDKLLAADSIYAVFSEKTGEAYLFSTTYDKGEEGYLCSDPMIMLYTPRWYHQFKETIDRRPNSVVKLIENTADKKGIENFLGTAFYLNGALGAAFNTKEVSISASVLVQKPDFSNLPEIQVPVMNPDIVTAIGLMILFTSARMERGYVTMLLAHIAFCTPYVIISVYPKVKTMDHNLANAAMDLGATPFQALTKVILPMIKPGIFAGMLLAFTMSIDDFVVSYFVTGNGVSNISIVVYNMTKRTNPTINALSTLLILVVVIILVLVEFVPKIVKRKRAEKSQWKMHLQVCLRKVAITGGVVVACLVTVLCITKFLSY